MQDMLVRMLAKQNELNATVTGEVTYEGTKLLTWTQKLSWAQRICQAIIVETSELLVEVGYKWWKKPKDPTPEQMYKIKMEVIDIVHFVLCLFILFEIHAEEVHALYFEKNEKNKTRPDWDNRAPETVLSNASGTPATTG